MRAAILLYARDKARWVERAAKSALAQEMPCEILLSDQHSTDGTAEILRAMAEQYSGPHTVRFMQCPVGGRRGKAALNEHLNWLFGQTEADVLLYQSADDYSLPGRVGQVMKIYEKHQPSEIGTPMILNDAAGIYLGTSAVTPGFVATAKVIPDLVGGSVAPALSRDFIKKFGGLSGDEADDVQVAYWATLDRGLFVADEPLYVQLTDADENNTGLMGRARAAKTDEERLALNELAHYQFTRTYYRIAQIAPSLSPMWHDQDIYQRIFNHAHEWAQTRSLMIQRGIPGGFL